MHLPSIFTVLAVTSAATAQAVVSVSYDTGYDDASRPISEVSCSDGANGVETKYGWTTQGQIPHFPYIGGSDQIPGWNSPNCGTCWTLTYNGVSINVLAIDHAANGFNIGEGAMNALTGGQAVQFGRVTATVSIADLSACGI